MPGKRILTIVARAHLEDAEPLYYRHLMWDFTLLHQITESLPWDSPVTNRALYTANAIMNEFDPLDLKSLKRCRKIAEGMLGEDWEKKIEASRDEGKDKDGTLWGLGHWCVQFVHRIG
jgi:alpha-mannosidase